jgi:hypothetical protein
MEFGLISLAVFRSLRAVRLIPAHEQIPLATLSLIVGVGLVDLLPNSTINPFSWLLVGALFGRVEAIGNVRVRTSGEKAAASMRT